jgi:hypothetical protein
MTRHILSRRPPLPPRIFILQDLVLRTGLKPRTLQVWGDVGVIVPTGIELHGGRGAARRYTWSELVIALLLTPFANSGTAIGHLVRIAAILRQALYVRQPGSAPALFEEGTVELGRVMMRAAAGQGQNFLAVAFNEETIFTAVATDEDGPPAFDPLALVEGGEGRRPRFGLWIDLSVLAGVFDQRR